VEPVRIVIIDVPRLLQDVVTRILCTLPGVEVTFTQGDTNSLAETVAKNDARIAIVGAARYAPADVRDTLLLHPLTKVLAVVGDGSNATLYELRPYVIELGEVSPERLVEIVDSARRPGPDWAEAFS
jgi:hypothetical protein